MDTSQEQFMPQPSPAPADDKQPPEAVASGSVPQPSDGIRARPRASAPLITS